MNLIIASSRYYPLLGGTVVVASRLAKALSRAGHHVTVLTNTQAGEVDDLPVGFNVHRCKPLRENLAAIRNSDGVIIIEMSLKWWLLTRIAAKPHLVTHHAYPSIHGEKPSVELRLQKFLSSFSPSTGCSKMIAQAWGKNTEVLPNPYDEEVFKLSDTPRDIDFVFAGRLIEEKGVLVFLDALGKILKKNHRFNFAVLGGGRQEQEISNHIKDLDLESQLVFFGETSSEQVAAWFQRTKCLVIPSVWKEPFGLIALEALACGARLICSDQEGLREASGGFADFFPTGDTEVLSELLTQHLDPENHQFPDDVEPHLSTYRSEAVARWIVSKLKAQTN